MPRTSRFYRCLARRRGIIIRSADLQDPEGLIRNITEHPALDEVTRNPLFLSTAIAVWRTSSALPATIYALLATFVLDVERGIHGTELSSVAHGQHRRYLEAFAQSLIDSHTTRLSFEETLRIVARCSNALLSENAIGSCPDAIRILDALLDHHLLVRTVSGTPTIGFFHQRFQEWFGAEHLARKITGATPSAIYELQADVVNFDAWTESLLLLADRFGEEQRDDLQASLVRCVLPVDLLFAAQLCGVMSAGGWETVHEEIERPVRTLASDPAVAVREYGLAAAAATRRADFSSLVWAELREADVSVGTPFIRLLRDTASAAWVRIGSNSSQLGCSAPIGIRAFGGLSGRASGVPCSCCGGAVRR